MKPEELGDLSGGIFTAKRRYYKTDAGEIVTDENRGQQHVELLVGEGSQLSYDEAVRLQLVEPLEAPPIPDRGRFTTPQGKVPKELKTVIAEEKKRGVSGSPPQRIIETDPAKAGAGLPKEIGSLPQK